MLGAKKEKEIRYVSAFCFYGGAAATLVFTALSLLFRTQLLHFLGTSEENIGYAVSYLFWVVGLGEVPTVLSMVLAHFLRSEGHARLASAETEL